MRRGARGFFSVAGFAALVLAAGLVAGFAAALATGLAAGVLAVVVSLAILGISLLIGVVVFVTDDRNTMFQFHG
ncbi:hypothetical protein D3C78_670200 [compost metagenome]